MEFDKEEFKKSLKGNLYPWMDQYNKNYWDAEFAGHNPSGTQQRCYKEIDIIADIVDKKKEQITKKFKDAGIDIDHYDFENIVCGRNNKQLKRLLKLSKPITNTQGIIKEHDLSNDQPRFLKQFRKTGKTYLNHIKQEFEKNIDSQIEHTLKEKIEQKALLEEREKEKAEQKRKKAEKKKKNKEKWDKRWNTIKKKLSWKKNKSSSKKKIEKPSKLRLALEHIKKKLAKRFKKENTNKKERYKKPDKKKSDIHSK